jgi:phosphohistidine phosphatase
VPRPENAQVPLVIDILRHGEAEPSSPDGDGARPLTDTGAARVRALARRLAAEGWAPDRVLASPLLRAQETGVLALAALPAAPQLETLNELVPEADPGDLAAALHRIGATRGHLLLVSHMPLVARLCGFFCGRAEAFLPADLARLECPDGPLARGTALWRGFPMRQDSG